MARSRPLPLALVLAHAWGARGRKYDTAYRFMQLTDVHIEPFYNPDSGHLKGDVCRVPEAFNKSVCAPFRVEPEAESYPFGRLNCDPPMALLRSIMEHMTRVAKEARPEFVVFTGDVPSHQLSCQFHAARTIEMVTAYLAQQLKDVAPKFYPVMGNNDYFPNYNISVEPGSPWQRYVASLYGRQGVLTGEQLDSFGYGGFYAANPKPGLRLLVLNTIIWSGKVLDWDASPKKHIHHHKGIDDDEAAYMGPDAPLPGADQGDWHWNQDTVKGAVFIPCEGPKRPRDPYGQLAWARGRLEAARAAGERVLVAGHVPPGQKVGDNNFCPGHQLDFEALTQEFADIIELQLYGDHSNDEFRMIWSAGERPKAVSSVLVSAGVTPRKHCNPSWRLFDVSSKHQVHDFTQYYLPLTRTNIKWNMNRHWRKLHLEGRDEDVSWKFWKKQYSFREQYGVGLDPEELEDLWLQMQRRPALVETYLRNMFSETVGTNDYFDYICDMRYLLPEQNAECAARGRLLDVDDERLARQELDAEMRLGVLPAEIHGRGDGSKSFVSAENDFYVQVHPGALVIMAGTCITLLASTLTLAWRLRSRMRAADYVAMA